MFSSWAKEQRLQEAGAVSLGRANATMEGLERRLRAAEASRALADEADTHTVVCGIPKCGEDDWVCLPPAQAPEVSTLEESEEDRVEEQRESITKSVSAPASPVVERSRAATSSATPPPRLGRYGEDRARRGLSQPTAEVSATVADDAFRRGQESMAAGDTANALRHFRRAKAACPPAKGRALAKIAELLSEVEAEVRRERERAEELFCAGTAALQQGQPRDALRLFREAQESCPATSARALARIAEGARAAEAAL